MATAIKTDRDGSYYEKTPGQVLDIEFDWSAWVTQEEQALSASEWEATDGLTLSSPTLVGSKTTVFFSGGIAGRTYRLINRVTGTTKTDERSIRIKVMHR